MKIKLAPGDRIVEGIPFRDYILVLTIMGDIYKITIGEFDSDVLVVRL